MEIKLKIVKQSCISQWQHKKEQQKEYELWQSRIFEMKDFMTFSPFILALKCCMLLVFYMITVWMTCLLLVLFDVCHGVKRVPCLCSCVQTPTWQTCRGSWRWRSSSPCLRRQQRCWGNIRPLFPRVVRICSTVTSLHLFQAIWLLASYSQVLVSPLFSTNRIVTQIQWVWLGKGWIQTFFLDCSRWCLSLNSATALSYCAWPHTFVKKYKLR